MNDPSNGKGCTVTVTNVETHDSYSVPQAPAYNNESLWQQHEYGTFEIQPSSRACHPTPKEGSGEIDPKFALDAGNGDSEAFNPHGRLTVEVTDFNGNDPCFIGLYNAETGDEVDSAYATAATSARCRGRGCGARACG